VVVIYLVTLMRILTDIFDMTFCGSSFSRLPSYGSMKTNGLKSEERDSFWRNQNHCQSIAEQQTEVRCSMWEVCFLFSDRMVHLLAVTPVSNIVSSCKRVWNSLPPHPRQDINFCVFSA